ncbi:MAG: hypothetical protein HZC41_04930 [Chloroflexi bacterium]|nr:hypothetical protein [Chloroflexota bacterium]
MSLCWVFLFYLLVAVIVTWPLVTVFSTRFIGHPFSDSYEYARFVWWFKYALQTGQSPYFQPWLAYPDGLTSWLLWSIPLQSFPAWLFALVLPLPAAMNLAVLLRLALNGWAMYLLVRRLTGQAAPALLSGVIFLAYPSFQGQLAAGHTGLLALWPVVLYVYSLQSSVVSLQSSVTSRQLPVASNPLSENTTWNSELGTSSAVSSQQSAVSSSEASALSTQHSTLSTPNSELGTRNFLLSTQYSVLSTSLFFVLSLLGSNQLLVYLLLPVTAVFALRLVIRRDWRALRRLIAAVALGGAVSLIFIAPGFIEALNAPPWLRERGDVTFSADLLSLVTPSFQHPLFGRLDYTHTVLGIDPFEKPGYVGIVAGLLALVGVWRRSAARWWLLVAAIGWSLSLGPLLHVLGQPVTTLADGYASFVPLPWALYQQLPLLNIVRVPARFHFAVALALAVMAGYGVASCQLPVARKKFSVVSSQFPVLKTRNFSLSTQYSVLSTLLLAAVVLWEYQLFWTGMPTIPADIPAAVAELAERNDVRAVFDVPYDHLLAAKEGLYLQTAHHKPLIAGQVTRRTPVNPAKLALLQTMLDPALLDTAGVDVIILHKEWDEGKIEPHLREQLGDPFYEDEHFALFDAPDSSAAPGFVATTAPDTAISDRADSYFYLPEPGTVTLRAELAGENRTVALLLDGVVVERWTISGEQAIETTLDAARAGYHTVTLALEPPCPASPHPALRCRTVQLAAVSLTPR